MERQINPLDNGATFSNPHPAPAPPNLRTGLSGATGNFAGITGGPMSSPEGRIGPDLLLPAPPSIGATSTPAPNQQPIAVATAHPAQLATPTKPNGQPLVASITQPKPLQVGNTQVAQSGGTTNAQTAPAPAPSIAHDLTHNPVTNVVGTTIKPLVQAGAAVAYTPEAVAREIQNKPIGDIQQKVFGTQDPGAIARSIPSDLAQVGLTVAAPGISKLIEGGVSRALPETTASIISKLAPKVAASGAIGSGYNAASAAGQGANAKQIAEAGGVGLGLGVAAPVAGALVRPVASAVLDHASALQPLGETGGAKAEDIPGVRNIGKNSEPEILKHYTTPETATALQNGAEFDYSKTPQHGMGGKGALLDNGGGLQSKFVNDGGPALYLSRDDPTWNKADVPTGKSQIVNIDHVTPEMLKDGYMQKNGLTGQYDYDQQKYVGVKNGTKQVNLSPVEHQLDPNARTLDIDSPAKLQQVIKEAGTTPEQPGFWSALRNKYDVVNIKNVGKNIQSAATDSQEQKFFRAAKGDQAIVLNPQVADRIESNGLPASMNRQFEKDSQPITAENNPDQYAEMMDNMPTKPKMAKVVSKSSKPIAEQKSTVGDSNLVTRIELNGRPYDMNDEQLTNKLIELQQKPRSERSITEEDQIKRISKALKDNRQNHSPAPPENIPLTGVGTKTSAPIAKQGSANLTPEEINMGKALGMNPDEVAKAKSDMAELPSGDQMASFEPKTELNSPEVNTARNPFKASIPKADSADQLIANVQKVGSDVDLPGQQFKTAYNKLSTQQQSDFMQRYVEHPEEATDPKVAEAVNRFQQLTDTTHGYSQALGGNTNYIKNYALHKYNLPEGIDEQAINGGGKSFQGINNLPRKYSTLDDAQAAGLDVRNAPDQAKEDINNFIGASGTALKKQTIRQGIADLESATPDAEKTKNFVIGNGESVRVTPQTYSQIKGLEFHQNSDNPLIKGYRTGNRGLKTTLLTHTGVHEANISTRAGGALAFTGHPLAAARAVAGGVRGNFDKNYVDRIFQKAVNDGTASKAAQIGANYEGGSGLLTRQLTPMHDQLVRTTLNTLEKRNIPLDSPQAREYGKAVNYAMGRVNYELSHVSKSTQNLLGDAFLAKQFTPSKFMTLKQSATAFNGAGNLSRANLAGSVIGTTALLAGIGAAVGQKSDNLKDTLLRALISPAGSINSKDSKGNNQQLKFLGTDTSDIARIIGLGLTRGQNGHLQVTWNKTNPVNNGEEYLRDRLAPLASDVLKVATNKNYADKPLYDPNASLGDKVAQALTSLGVGSLPIATQSLAYSKVVKDIAPNSVRAVLNANTPKSNTALNAALGTVGFTENTDQTKGQGQQSSQYYNALATAKQGLNHQAADALDLVTGSKKNPVTGKYDVMPTAFDSSTKANALLQNPSALQHLVSMNQQLEKQGQKVDPFYNLSPVQQKQYLAYQTLPTAGADRANWMQRNGSWYQPFQKSQSDFYSGLPAGDPNKPAAPVQSPSFDSDTQNLLNQYNSADSATKSQIIQDNPKLTDAFDQIANYDNATRSARLEQPLKGYPQASGLVQAQLNEYNGLDSASKSTYLKSHPDITSYFTQTALYNLDKNAGEDVFQGSKPDQEELKSTYTLGNYDVMKNSDGTYTLGANPEGGSSGGSGYNPVGLQGYSMSNASVGRAISKATNKPYYAGAVAKPAKYLKVQRYGGKAKVAKVGKPKTLKATAVKGTL